MLEVSEDLGWRGCFPNTLEVEDAPKVPDGQESLLSLLPLVDQPRNYIAKSIHRWVAIVFLLLDHLVQLALELHMACIAPVGVVAVSEIPD